MKCKNRVIKNSASRSRARGTNQGADLENTRQTIHNVVNIHHQQHMHMHMHMIISCCFLTSHTIPKFYKYTQNKETHVQTHQHHHIASAFNLSMCTTCIVDCGVVSVLCCVVLFCWHVIVLLFLSFSCSLGSYCVVVSVLWCCVLCLCVCFCVSVFCFALCYPM